MEVWSVHLASRAFLETISFNVEVRIAYWRGCPVAVKMLYEALAEYQRNVDLLLQEVSVAWKMHHPNVVAVCGIVLERKEKKTTAWIVMELLQGSMSAVINASLREEVGALTLRERVDMAHDSLCGLDYLHTLVSDLSVWQLNGSHTRDVQTTNATN